MKKTKTDLTFPKLSGTENAVKQNGTKSKKRPLTNSLEGNWDYTCAATVSIDDYQIKVEGLKAKEVKEVASFLLSQTHKTNNTKLKFPKTRFKQGDSSKWDVFISHAFEDKSSFVKKLANALSTLGVKVWYDEFTLKVGMSLVNTIDNGLSKSNYGIVILSKHFISKRWTDYEKRSLISREVNGKDLILPIWHQITKQEVLEFSPFLADKVALNTSKDSLQTIVLKLLEVIRPDIYDNYHRHLKYLEMIRNAKPVKTNPKDLKISEIRHKELPQHQLNRIKNIHYTVGKYFDSSLEKSIEDYKRDLKPEREIKTWEIIASTFNDFINKFAIVDETIKKDIASTLLLFSLGQVPETTHLTNEGLTELYEMWKGNFHIEV